MPKVRGTKVRVTQVRSQKSWSQKSGNHNIFLGSLTHLSIRSGEALLIPTVDAEATEVTEADDTEPAAEAEDVDAAVDDEEDGMGGTTRHAKVT